MYNTRTTQSYLGFSVFIELFFYSANGYVAHAKKPNISQATGTLSTRFAYTTWIALQNIGHWSKYGP